MNGQPPKPRRGCFFYGCLTGLVLLLIMVVGLLIGVHYVKKMVNQFTDTQPLALPGVQLSQPEIEKLRERLDVFDKALKEHRLTEPLILTSDEVNAWIASTPSLKALKSKVYVSLEGDQLRGKVSIPMGEIGLGIFRGRYLNGAGTFNMSFQNGLLRVMPREITVKGNPLPGVYMQTIRQQDLAQSMNNDPQAASQLDRFQEISIKDSKLIIVPKEVPAEVEKKDP